nr:secreted protein CSS1 [Drosophila takahashii]
MRLCLLVLGCVIAASAWPVDQLSVRDHGVNGWFVPQREGGLRWISKAQGELQLEYYEAQDALGGRWSTNTVNFYLYTLQNPSTGQQIKGTKASIDASYFNPENPTRITIHGWNSNYKDGVNTRIADAWFQYGDYNMIAVDWQRGRSLEYATSVAGAPGAGKKVAALVDFLVETYGMRLDTLEVVGFSLGAHVAGHTAKQVTTGKVGKVVGLDPASPLLSYSKTEKRLSSDDAVYVESIQTNGAILGFSQPIGKAAFYMNGGRSQPGCGIDLTGSCSHTKAVMYYVEALLYNNFPSKRCESYKDANKNTCGDQYCSISMGAIINTFVAEGIFYVPVNKESPYGFGQQNSGGEGTTALPETSTTTEKPEEPTRTTGEPEETTVAPEESTTDEPEEDSTTTQKPEEPSSTTEEPEDTTADPVKPTTDEPVSTTTNKPAEPSSTTQEPEETTVAPEDSTTEEPEETSVAPELSTTEEPEETTVAPEETTTDEPEEISTTTNKPEEPSSTTQEPAETTVAPEDSTTEEPEETTVAPVDSTTEEPEETTVAPEETTTEEPEEVTTTTNKPEEPSTTTQEPEETSVAPEESTTEEPEETTSTTEAPVEVPTTTKKPEEASTTTVAPEESTTVDPEDIVSTTEEPEEVTTTVAPLVPTTTARPTESTTPVPEIPPTSPPNDDNVAPPGTKNIFIFNVFLVNVKIEK